ncbi:lipocalin family protein [Pontibacter ruber]|uniref:Lipocalin family protein n=1 Tax=Pontibacter ruber TaxID=1343895 RepID=A0ABW5CY98_9BACT|nr:lipocalin family protein [Pontibacter ruber]
MNLNLKRQLASWQAVMALLLVFVMASCGGKDKVGTENMISGSSSKTWVAKKELTASGEKDKLTEQEKEETMQFYSDGRFAMGGGGSLETGTWSFDQAAKKLTLRFEGQDVTENFDVVQLTDKEMRLKDATGGEMQLKAQ